MVVVGSSLLFELKDFFVHGFISTPVGPLKGSSLRVLELLWQLEEEWLADGPLGWVLEGQILPFSYHGSDPVGCPIDR